MRIAFITWEFPPFVVGGLGVYSDNMVRGLVACGHDVVVFTANSGQGPEDGAYAGATVVRPQAFDASPAFPHVVESSLQAWGPFFNDLYVSNLLWVDRLLGIHQKQPFDVISVQDWLSAPAGLALAARKIAPVVFHIHSTEWGRRGEGASPTVTYWEKELGARAAAVVTVSQAMKQDLLEHGFEQDQLCWIWNGIDPGRYHPDAPGRERVRAAYGLDGDESLTLFVGRLTAVKGVLELIEAWARVVSVFPEARLVLLGSGELQSAVKGQIADLGLGDCVILRAEFLPEEERIAHYAAADLCVFPSHYEPFGIVCLEAMAMGKPVVVGARGLTGFREQAINDGDMKCGVHVNGGSHEDIAWGIGQCLRDPARAARWGANGRRRAESLFTWAETVSKTVAVYEGLIARG